MSRQDETTSFSWLAKLLCYILAIRIVRSSNTAYNAMETNAFVIRPAPLLPTSYLRHRTSLSSSSNISHLSATDAKDTAIDDNDGEHSDEEAGEGGIYRPFADYAWSKLSSSGLVTMTMDEVVPIAPAPEDDGIKSGTTSGSASLHHLQYNSSPARGHVDGSIVAVRIKSCSGNVSEDNEENASLRLGRFALLETLSPSSTNGLGREDGATDIGKGVESDQGGEASMVCVPDAIHVLNLVLFPNHANPLLTLPILGIDLVTLPGGRHLIAMDFQPVLPPGICKEGDGDSHDTHSSAPVGKHELFPTGSKYTKYEGRIAALHERHVTKQPQILPWGGDIPPNAQRFFSPYALWTRLNNDNGSDSLAIIRKEVYDAFCDYFDLYLELLMEVQGDQIMGGSKDNDKDGHNDKNPVLMNEILQGHREYLTYRQENDPARPMLTRLYGKEWTEQAIEEVLFKMI